LPLVCPEVDVLAPARAAAAWPEVERTGPESRLADPSRLTDDRLARFMDVTRRRRLRVDFSALHYDQDSTNPDVVDQLQAQLTELLCLARADLDPRDRWVNIRSSGARTSQSRDVARAVSWIHNVFAVLPIALPIQRETAG
jgi:hypothetical protein